ncbi:50S ribosomal protein L25/general stress protein Ctc [Bacillaceae bacterium]
MGVALLAKKRTDLSKSNRKRLRKEGQIPAILYGKEVETTPIYVSGRDFHRVLKEHGINTIIDLEVEGNGTLPVLVYDYHTDVIKGDIIHIDFKKINMNEEIETVVPLDFVGEAKGEEAGGVLQIQLRELEISCLPDRIPEEITVDISSLDIGDRLTVADLQLPEGIEVLNDGDEIVVTVLEPTLDPVNEGETPEEPQLVEQAKNAKPDGDD